MSSAGARARYALTRGSAPAAQYTAVMREVQLKIVDLESTDAKDADSRHAESGEAKRHLGGPTLVGSLCFESILDEVAVGYFEIDARGVVLHANPSACRQLGIHEGRIHKPVLAAYLHARSMHRFYSLVKQLMECEGSASGDLEVRHPGGHSFWARFDGTVRRAAVGEPRTCLLSMIDISAQRAADEQIRASEHRLRSLIESIPDSIFVIHDKRIVFANGAAQKLVNSASRRDMIGVGLEQFLAPDDRRLLTPLQSLQSRPSTTVPPVELRFRSRNGDYLLAETTWISIQFEREHCLLCVARDLTERKQMQARLAQTDRLTTAGVLAAGVAHEINNPLTYIFLNLESVVDVLGDCPELPEHRKKEMGECAERALVGAKRVRDIVKDLRACTTDGDCLELVSLNDVVEKTLEIAEPQLRYKTRIERVFGEIPAVLANFGRLSQVFLNLFMNAAHAIEEEKPEWNRLRVSTQVRGGEVLILVQDTGKGIPEAARARLFEPFFTTKDVGEGSGLGLYICHQYVVRYGGTIELTDQPGFSTSFAIRLPVEGGLGASPSRAISSLRATGPVQPKSVLVIDDDAIIRAALGRMLSQSSAGVVLAESGAEAIERLGRGEIYDLMLCDVLMPNGSGPEVYRWIEHNRPAILPRLAFITGGAYTDESRRFMAEVRPPCLAKPFSPVELQRFVEERLVAVEALCRPGPSLALPSR